MILMSVLCTLSFRRMATFAKHMFYLIPGPVWLALKTLIFLFLFVFVELYRYRYDRLMVGKFYSYQFSLVSFTLATLYSFELF
jgi:NADH:ubiquinone oxidoreductase subunit H